MRCCDKKNSIRLCPVLGDIFCVCYLRVQNIVPSIWCRFAHLTPWHPLVEEIGRLWSSFFLSVSCRVPILAKARSPVRAPEQAEGLHPGPAHRYVLVPAWPGHVLAPCEQRPAEPLRRERSTNGGPRQPSPKLAQPVGLGAHGGRLGVGPASLRRTQRACTPPVASSG